MILSAARVPSQEAPVGFQCVRTQTPLPVWVPGKQVTSFILKKCFHLREQGHGGGGLEGGQGRGKWCNYFIISKKETIFKSLYFTVAAVHIMTTVLKLKSVIWQLSDT